MDTQREIKILGVTMDQQLRMDTHVAKATARSLGACIRLRQLKGLAPRQIR